jgi:RNA polymerase sigma-70 factor (ECF subfamily)
VDADFAGLVERYQGELRVHCYRMLGSLEEAEDLVQETFLRAWKNLGGFEGRSSVRAWLYRIATNACLDALEGKARRVLPYDVTGEADVPWLQPFPDGPDTVVIARETIELAFLAAIQHLPPRQRAVLILRDVLGWPAKDTADLLEGTAASVNSALQRARATLKARLPDRLAWRDTSSEEEQKVLRQYTEAMESGDLDAVAKVLAEEVRTAMPPWTHWLRGRDAVIAALTENRRRFRMVPAGANRQPAVATYADGQAFAISLLTIDHTEIVEITAFHDLALFPKFGLPMSF